LRRIGSRRNWHCQRHRTAILLLNYCRSERLAILARHLDLPAIDHVNGVRLCFRLGDLLLQLLLELLLLLLRCLLLLLQLDQLNRVVVGF